MSDTPNAEEERRRKRRRLLFFWTFGGAVGAGLAIGHHCPPLPYAAAKWGGVCESEGPSARYERTVDLLDLVDAKRG